MRSRNWMLYCADTVIYSLADLSYNDSIIEKKQSEVSHMNPKLRIMTLMDKMAEHPRYAHSIM